MTQCKNYWKLCLQKFYSVLDKSVEDNNNNSIIGLIIFINTLFKEIEAKGEIVSSDYVQFYNKGDEFTFICSEKNFKQVIVIGSSEPVWSVREKLSYYAKIPINNVFFKNNKKFISYNNDFEIFQGLALKNYIVDIVETPNILSSLTTNPCTLVKEDERLWQSLFKLLKLYKLNTDLNKNIQNNNSQGIYIYLIS